MSTAGGEDRGQATIEFALVLPLVVLLVAGLLQVGLMLTTQLTLEHAARAGARAAAVAPDRAAAEASSAARRSAGDRAISVSTVVGPKLVTVEVSAPLPALSWLPGIDGRRLRADVVMRREDLG